MLTLNFLSSHFAVTDTTMVVLIMVDRYLHVMYLNNYSTVFTLRRYHISLVLMQFSSVLRCVIGLVLLMTYDLKTEKTWLITSSSFPLLCGIILYIISYIRLWKLQKLGRRFGESQKSIIKIASFYLFLTKVRLLTLLIQTLLVLTKTHKVDSFVIYLLNPIVSIYGILNSIVFMAINRATTNYLQEFFRQTLSISNDSRAIPQKILLHRKRKLIRDLRFVVKIFVIVEYFLTD